MFFGDPVSRRRPHTDLPLQIRQTPTHQIVGAGTFFVIFSMSFFTGTQVGLEGFQGLQQIGAQAFTGLVSSWANTREITPLVAGVALAAQVGTAFTAEIGAAGSPTRSTPSR